VNAVIRERQNTADDASARYERSDELLEQAKQHVSACTSQVAPLEDQQKELDDQFKQNKQDLMDKQVSVNIHHPCYPDLNQPEHETHHRSHASQQGQKHPSLSSEDRRVPTTASKC